MLTSWEYLNPDEMSSNVEDDSNQPTMDVDYEPYAPVEETKGDPYPSLFNVPLHQDLSSMKFHKPNNPNIDKNTIWPNDLPISQAP